MQKTEKSGCLLYTGSKMERKGKELALLVSNKEGTSCGGQEMTLEQEELESW